MSRIDAEPLPIPDGGSGGATDGSDTDGSGSGGWGTGGTTDCDPLDPEVDGLVLAQDYEIPAGSEAFICDDDDDGPEPNDDGEQSVTTWVPAGSCGYFHKVTGYMPPPKIFGVYCSDLVGTKVPPDEDGGADAAACKEVMDASNKCLDDARKQCDAYAAGKGGTADFKVDYKYEKECYFSSAKRKRNLNIIGVVCEGQVDRDANWKCNVST